MDNKEFSALVRLIDDPSNDVFEAIREKLHKSGPSIIPKLEKAWELSMNSLYQSRIEQIIHDIHKNNIQQQLKAWVANGAKDLFTGAFLIAKYQYPELDKNNVSTQIEAIKNDVWLEINDQLTALEKTKTLNHILFSVHKFKRSSSFQNSLATFFINNTIETKKGSPIGLAIIYAIIAQKLNMPIFGVNLPKNFILCYSDHTQFEEKPSFEHNVLFYINPYNNGLIFGKKEIDFFLKQQKLESKEAYYQACSNKESIIQLLKSIIEFHNKKNNVDKENEYKELLNILYF